MIEKKSNMKIGTILSLQTFLASSDILKYRRESSLTQNDWSLLTTNSEVERRSCHSKSCCTDVDFFCPFDCGYWGFLDLLKLGLETFEQFSPDDYGQPLTIVQMTRDEF